MPITSVTKDAERLTMTVVADFSAPLQRLWDAYADPRQLEKFWGPPSFPSRFLRHDFAAGGRSNYVMTGPNGESHGGYWDWIGVSEPSDGAASFEVTDGFAFEDCTPNPEMPNMRMVFSFAATATGSRVTTTTYFNSAEQLEQLLTMGMEEGMREAMGQMDAVLADLKTYAAGVGITVDVLSDTQVRMSRVIRGSVADIWRAHQEPELMKQWLLGPDGWVMTECDYPAQAGTKYHFRWAREDGSDEFGFGGEIVALEKPHRMVTTERMFGEDGPQTLQEITLVAVEGGTLLTQVHTYESLDAREQALNSGMVDGMEPTYARLESLLVSV